jgi:cyclase
MSIRTQPAHRLSVIVVLAMAAAASAAAQYGKPLDPAVKGAGDATLTAQFVKTGLFLISGGGGNTVLRLSANGLIVVDGKLPGNYETLRKRFHRMSDQPVRALILTDHYEIHSGTNAKFLEAGARIIAQENVKRNLAAYNPPGGAVAPPNLTYEREYKLQLGGAEVELFHFGNARTDGDTVVYFPAQKVVAMGDLYASAPNPDYSAGGSLVGWGPVLGQILKLDFDVVVPGEGPPVSRADLQAFKAKIDTLVSRATELVNKGVAKDQLMTQLKTDDLGWHLSFTGDQVDHFYAELSQPK